MATASSLVDAIDLLVVASDPALARRVAVLEGANGFCVTTLHAVHDAVRSARDPGRARVLVIVSHSPPTTALLQDLLDVGQRLGAPVLCLLQSPDAAIVAALLAAGVQDVVDVEEVTSDRLSRLVVASLTRERMMREMAYRRRRALLKRDTIAAVAAAGTRQEIHEAFAHGLLALGALGAACWERVETGFMLVFESGVATELARTGVLAFDAAHPAAQCARTAAPLWFEDAASVASAHEDYLPPDHRGLFLSHSSSCSLTRP